MHRFALAFAALTGLAGCTSDITVGVTSVDDLGALPLPPFGVGRDGGFSGELGGQILWTFGDTFLSAPNHIDGATVLSATGGWSTRDAPLDLAQAMDGDQPAQVIPYTADEIAANTADSLNGYALWPGALVPLDDTTGVIAFQHVKRTNGSGFATDGIGLARIHAGDAIATRDPDLLFTTDQYVPQVAAGGYIYAWSCGEVGTLDFRCKLARALTADVATASAYEYYDGTDWQSDPALAAYVLDRSAGGPSVSYNAFLNRYLAVNCEVVSSTVLLRTADAIEGPWSAGIEIQAGSAGILAPTQADGYNYICVEHPELASVDTIVIGYSRPTAPFMGDVRLARVTLR
jgi:hypothetical protein